MRIDPSKKERLSERMQGHAGRKLSSQDKRRLYVMGIALVLVVAMFIKLNSGQQDGEFQGEPVGNDIPVSVISKPPLDQAMLEGVRDSTAQERVILEPEAFQSIVRGAQLLLPSHFRDGGEYELPFDEMESRSAELRGRGFRHRGRLMGARRTVRAAGAPEEYWSWIRTDGGKDLIFASLTVPEDLFGSENYVRADGLYFKIYTWSYEEQRITAPLIVGKELVSSFRAARPVTELDFDLLNRVRDPELTDEVPLDWDARWHLMNFAQAAAANPARLDELFAEAPELDKEGMNRFLNEDGFPADQRGLPWIIHCKVHDSWTSTAGENPLRVTEISQGYAGNTNWGMPLIRILLPGRVELPVRRDMESYRVLRGWFLQNHAYETNDGSRRRAPTFVIADVQIGTEPGMPAWVLQMMLGFLGLAVVLSTLIYVMIRKDRREAKKVNEALQKIRRNVRANRAT